MTEILRLIYNGTAIDYKDVPSIAPDLFFDTMIRLTGHGWRVVSYFAIPEASKTHTLCCVLAYKAKGQLGIVKTEI